MDDFPSNSRRERMSESGDIPVKNKAVEPKVKVERVVQSEVIRKKKSLSKKFKETFVGGDARSVWGYIFLDVMIPAAKDMMADATSQGMEKMLYGEVRSTSRRGGRGRSQNGYVNYSRYSANRPPWEPNEPRRDVSPRGRQTHDFDEVILETRGEAEQVIEQLFELVSKYEQATVSDLYGLVGISGDYTDEKWGWTELRGAQPVRVRNGYLLDLPRPEPLR